MTQRDRLYGITAEPFADMNQRAHRGGGTETIDVPSGEGLVEDQYEAQLKGLYVAYREPTAQALATLAGELEAAGFVVFADQVDQVLAKFYQPELVKQALSEVPELEQIKRVILHHAKVARGILDNAGFQEWGIIHNLAAKPKIIGWLDSLSQAVSAAQPNWDGIAATLAKLLDPSLLEGSALRIGEVDLENVLGAQFKNYKEALEAIDAKVHEAQSLTVGQVEQDTGERQKIAPPAPDAADPRPYIASAQAINQQISNLQQVAELAINRQPNDQKRAQTEAQINKMFQQSAPLFSLFRKKTLPALSQIQAMSPEVKSSFDPVLQQVSSRVATLKAQMELI